LEKIESATHRKEELRAGFPALEQTIADLKSQIVENPHEAQEEHKRVTEELERQTRIKNEKTKEM
jgi:hypothetical protein